MRVLCFGLSAICLWPIQASANWQYTRWNMTPSQVVAASKGQAAVPDDADALNHNPANGSDVTKLVAPFQTGAFKFKVYFKFEDEKLDGVELDLVDGNPHAVIGLLRSKYGKTNSEDTSDPTWRTWYWQTKFDFIEALMIGEDLTLHYGAAHDSAEKGL